MIYKLDADFRQIEERNGLMQNKSRYATIEIVTADGAPEKDTGISLRPQAALSFSVEKGKSLYARCQCAEYSGANLAIVNFNSPASGESGAGGAVGSVLYSHFVMPGYVKADGQLLGRIEYANLFACASENGLILPEADWAQGMQGMYGEGDGSTTFRVPDLRGYFLRALDDEAGIDSSRDLGSVQEDAIRNIVGEIKSTNNGPNYIFLGDSLASGGALEVVNAGSKYAILSNTNLQFGCDAFTFDASRAVPTAKENRPKNIALIAQIKY